MPKLIRAIAEEAGITRPERVSSGVDVVGDIAIVRLAELPTRDKKRLAGALLKEVKNVKCVFEQEGGIEGEYRLRRLRHLAGEKRTLTLHRENGCAFRVDVAKCYFSPRLATERLAIAGKVGARERVLNMFAGVGPFSITVARLSGARVTSCETNPYACQLHLENNRLNKVERKVKVLPGDAGELPGRIRSRYDRILMPLPSEADRFLGTALKMARENAVIHYYRHVLGRDESEAAESLTSELSELLPASARCEVRKVREVGARWLELAADVRLES